jgi:hypothetical protein
MPETLSAWYHGLPKVCNPPQPRIDGPDPAVESPYRLQVTKTYMTCAFASTCLFMAGMLNPGIIAWAWQPFFYKFQVRFVEHRGGEQTKQPPPPSTPPKKPPRFPQVWRFAMCFCFFGKFSMGFVFSLYILHQYVPCRTRAFRCSSPIRLDWAPGGVGSRSASQA